MSRRLISLLAKMVSGLTEFVDMIGIISERRETTEVILLKVKYYYKTFATAFHLRIVG